MGIAVERNVVLQVASEGGDITLFRVQNGGETHFQVQSDKSAAYQVPTEEDQDGVSPRSCSPLTDSWDQALKQLDRYPWASLNPLQVHPAFAANVLSAVKERIQPDSTPRSRQILLNWIEVTDAAGAYRPGLLVELPNKPEWGPGRIVNVRGDHLHIYFRDLNEDGTRAFLEQNPYLRIAQVQRDPLLDNLPPFKERDGSFHLSAPRLTFDAAMKLFFDVFPLGFEDPRYVMEVKEKREAHERFTAALGVERIKGLLQAGDLETLVKEATSVISEVGFMLAMFENAALHDAMQDFTAATALFDSLVRLLEAKQVEGELAEDFFRAVCALPVKRSRVATWPIATVLLYVADPARYMFLKPEVTKAAADRLAFDLHYDSVPNWTTYEALLRMGNIYLDLLRPLGAKDFIDVQTFIFVAGGGYS
jgi:hypothetical protein